MIITIVLVIIDIISKMFVMNNKIYVVVIPKILNFTYVENRGMVFGIAQGSNTIMSVMSAIICTGIIIYLIWMKKKNQNICFAWYMILAGGIGNLIDRIKNGFVVDFIDTPWIATFNLADSFIVVGIIILIIDILLDLRKQHLENDRS